MEGKKISFGFMKTKKAEKPVVEEKREYIECLEEKSIKVVGGEIQDEKAPLVIPMKPNTLITAERLKQIAEEVESGVYEIGVKNEPMDTQPGEKPPENESIEQQAVRELLQDAKKDVKVEKIELTVPIKTDPPLTGQKESTLDDYESVPIQDFGLAMLRGMGWTPGEEKSKYKEPQLRPKGLGLGADKVVKQNQKKATSSNSRDDDKELMIVKNAFVKITCGKYSGFYGKVLSLDEDNGRVMVDITVKKETVSLSEFMMQPVTKSEYDKQSKVINADKYEEYKNNEKQSFDSSRDKRQGTSKAGDKEDYREERSRSDKIRERDGREDSRSDDRRREERRDEGKSRKDVESNNGRNREADRKRRSSSNSSQERDRKHRKYSSNDSLSSDSERKKKSKHKKHKREKDSSKSSDSDSSDSYSKKKSKKKKHKRDIDKKRKGKKKKRDRDRSPNYKKYRK